MALTVRRVVGRMVAAGAAALAVVTLLSWSQGGGTRRVELELDVERVPGVRSARIEVRRGTEVVATAARRYGSGLPGHLRLSSPSLGADGEVRIWLDTDGGPLQARRPLTAAGGSVVTIVAGED